ncbi:hypothetical protein GF351_02565 [Candidatus Woesearchaeota archaeon]|nr:hypothetical protein [Candidatus Woesearchaeota archaeon]
MMKSESIRQSLDRIEAAAEYHDQLGEKGSESEAEAQNLRLKMKYAREQVMKQTLEIREEVEKLEEKIREEIR